MDIDGGLPWDADDSGPTAPPPPAPAPDDVDMLDRPLDDFVPRERGGRARSPVPEHVQALMGRMGKGKVYLAEETPGIIHHDAERRIARDPRLTRLALELDRQDPTEWLAAVSAGAGSTIRPNALFVSSELIKHLSTAKVFTWASEFGVGIMGIEWLNDSTLILLFPTPAAALLSLSMLAKAGFDPTDGDDPLEERAAHGFPASLLPRRSPTPEPDRRVADLDAELEGLAEAREAEDGTGGGGGDSGGAGDPDAPVRKGRGAFRASRGSANGAFDLPPLAGQSTPRFAEGVDPHARVTVRYATTDDTKHKRGAGESSWYAKHGRAAGKETAARRSGGGRWEEARDLKDRVGTRGEGREFARRIGAREERERERERGGRRSRVEDLDADLEWMARRREGEDDGRGYGRRYGERKEGGGGRRERGERAPRRPRANQDDLDRELDEMFASRGDD
ncbi:hypothetical protein CC85DRAFT_286208 [Cutaneotrichosporon oleaginosum]|uniref:Uncharacterized protein n=1 Tax=Cutaneotrichosporon oleaginosum TaxID=879819 RepID=A0A0J0XKN1_9TREE|nr:uncharacterized protein CC85DRAFT_286208 [Cutaneotrichosporon oleaginosum]KLT41673.1 hypothetical protein CC85DRAFT_286208 [Cutaneotrichosporon oleaginosum]TXT08045.1 hypothetical protein COLE_04969 [Cutaneotrichosporon oleaginosum]